MFLKNIYMRIYGWVIARNLRIFLIVPLLIFIGGCKEPNYITIPAVLLLDTAQYDGETYYLYSKTDGWHEKQTIFDLYKGEPEFNACKKASFKPVTRTPHDHEKYVSKMIFQPTEINLIKVIFTSDKASGYANTDDVKFE